MDSLVSSWRSYWSSNTEAPPPPSSSIIPFPPLPPELILRILTLSLPLPSYNSLSPTGRLTLRLQQFASLHPSFHSHFIRLSHLHIRLSTLNSSATFLRTAQREGWAERVRSLRLGDWKEEGGTNWLGEGAVVDDLLRVCKGVEELYIAGLSGLDLRYLEGGKNLRTLYLTESRLTLYHPPSSPSPPSLLLPSLTHLHLRSTIFTGYALPTLLSPLSLPSLRTLDYLSVHQSLVDAPPAAVGRGGGTALTQLTASLSSLSSPSRHTPSHPAHPLLPQLHHLALGPHATKTLSALDVATCSELRTLDLPLSMGVENRWEWPETLRGVRWRAGEKEEQREKEEEGAEEVVGKSLEWFIGDEVKGGSLVGGGEGGGERTRKVILTLPSRRSSSPPSLASPSSSTSPPIAPAPEPAQELIHHRLSPTTSLEVLVWRGGPWDAAFPQGDGDGHRLVSEGGEKKKDNGARDGPFDVGLERWREEVRRWGAGRE